jgi:geranylgeranyl pyrophosphate synthase
VLHALNDGPNRDELQRLLAHGPPDGELLDRALEIVRSGGSIEHARSKVSAEVARAVGLAEQLPPGPARHALIQLSRFLAIRCGAEAGP